MAIFSKPVPFPLTILFPLPPQEGGFLKPSNPINENLGPRMFPLQRAAAPTLEEDEAMAIYHTMQK